MSKEKDTLNENQISLVKEKTLNFFSFLHTEYGYSEHPNIKTYNSTLLKFWVEYLYSNPSIKRSISINYFPFDKEGKQIDSISITIIKEPYNNVDDYINFELLLEKKQPGFNPKLLELQSYEGTFEQRVDLLFMFLIKLLKEHAENIISGNEWEEGCYPKW